MTPTDSCFTGRWVPFLQPWIAIHRDSALKLLKDYDLTEAQKNSIDALMLEFCNVLNDAGLIHYGKTEGDAIMKACAASFPTEDSGDGFTIQTKITQRQLEDILINEGIIQAAAVEDPFGYDGGKTELSITIAAQQINKLLCPRPEVSKP